jgi:hypothetical protein
MKILTFDEFINESLFVSPAERDRQALERIKETIKKAADKLHEDPDRSEIHKLELDIANSKLNTFNLQKRLKDLKEKYAK